MKPFWLSKMPCYLLLIAEPSSGSVQTVERMAGAMRMRGCVTLVSVLMVQWATGQQAGRLLQEELDKFANTYLGVEAFQVSSVCVVLLAYCCFCHSACHCFHK